MTLLYITHPALEICFQSFNFLCQSFIFCLGPFNNYVDKMRGGWGSKNSCFYPRSGYKNCPRRRGGGIKKWQNSVHVVVEGPLSRTHWSCSAFAISNTKSSNSWFLPLSSIKLSCKYVQENNLFYFCLLYRIYEIAKKVDLQVLKTCSLFLKLVIYH